MCMKFVVAKTAIGARNIGQAPTQTATPSANVIGPRYIGLRVKRYGPRVTSARLVGEVGLISVPARRNSPAAQTGGMNASTTSAMPSGGEGKTGSWGQPSAKLKAAAATRKINVQIGGGSLSIMVPFAFPLAHSHLRNLHYRSLR